MAVRVVLDNEQGMIRIGDYAEATIEVPNVCNLDMVAIFGNGKIVNLGRGLFRLVRPNACSTLSI